MPRPRPRSPKAWVPLPLPTSHGILTPLVVHVFAELRVNAAVWMSGAFWHPLHAGPDIQRFEYDYDVIERRRAYNHTCLEKASGERRSVLGTHAGLHDLFVPIIERDHLRGVLVTGPFATQRPSAAQVRERWLELTGSPAKVNDPMFVDYLSATLSTLTLEGPLLADFERLVSCFVRLMGGQGDVTALAAEIDSLRPPLNQARFVDRMWAAARVMTDERTNPVWATHSFSEMRVLGIDHFPKHVVVGLFLSEHDENDPLDELLRRDAFQRACVTLARKHGNAACGQAGEHGVFFLLDRSGSAARIRANLAELADRAAQLARRFGLKLHAGICQTTSSGSLRACFLAALAAAEEALARRKRTVFGQPHPVPSVERLRMLRRDLAKPVTTQAPLLCPHFDRYIEVVLLHSGYRIEVARAELDAGLERLTDSLVAGGFLDEKGLRDFWSGLDGGADGARTPWDLVAAYRRCVAEIEATVRGPTDARRDRGIHRARAFIREHLAGPLDLPQVARAAGFSPDYFWKLFKRSEGMTFTRYVHDQRLARAKELLKDTTLTIEQVQHLSGFQSRTSFYRTFQSAVGTAPLEYREGVK